MPKAQESAFWASAVRCVESSLHENFTRRLSETVSEQRVSTRGVGTAAIEKQYAASAWLLEALYQGQCCLPPRPIALPRSTKAYSSNRIHAVPHGYDVVTRVLRAAEALGWIRISLGFDGGESGQGSITRVHAAGELLDHFHSLGVRWQPLEAPPKEQTIIVAMKSKGRDRRLVDRDEDPKVAAMQDNLHRINTFLLRQCITLNCADTLLLDDVDGVIKSNTTVSKKKDGKTKDRSRALNFQDVTMRRIFARGSLEKGGRFYSGWWQHISSEYRQQILINGHLTIEADFSGIALVCLYAIEGKTMDGDDPYDIGLHYKSPNDPKRKIVKQYINAIINDDKGTYRIGSKELKALGLTSRELRRRVMQKHRHVQHKFNTGVGLDLQYVDSRIAERVMLRFLDLGEVCLPIHDSFIVRAGMKNKLLEIMDEEFQGIANTTTKIKATIVDRTAGIGSLSGELPVRPKSMASMLIDASIRHLSNYSIMLNYYNSWRDMALSEEERQAEDLAVDQMLDAAKDKCV